MNRDQFKIYHERQVMQLCALHSLNNLLQQRVFTKNQLDQICQRLSPGVFINPHRSMLGIGNYDVNVLISALQQKQLELLWFDKRKTLSSIRFDHVTGFILNVLNQDKTAQRNLINRAWNFVNYIRSRNHWICVRKIGNDYMNLDSKLPAPVLIGGETQLVEFLEQYKQNPDCELFIVVAKEFADQVFRE